MEFAGHRPYEPGDEVRRVDWRRAARRGFPAAADRREPGGGLLVKQFEAESGLAVHLVCDLRAGMAYRGPAADGSPGDHPSKWRFAAICAATLAEATVRRRDAVSLSFLGRHGPTPLPPSAAPDRTAAVCGALSAAVPAGGGGLREGLAAAAGRWRRRGQVVLISDLLDDADETFAALSDLRRRGHEPTALRALAPAEVAFPFPAPRRFRPLTGGALVPGGGAAGRAAYLAAFEAHAAELAAACRRAGAPLATATTDEPVAAALVRLLTAGPSVRRS